MAPTRLLLDVDTGIDDAVALLYLCAVPEVRLEGITCTAGNVGAAQVAANNLALLELAGRSGVEVAIGSEVPLVVPLVTTEETHGDQGVGYAVLPAARQQVSDRSAVEVWVEAARANPGEITGLITGPLTNFALALRAEPRLPMLLKGLVIMGGAFNYPGNTTPVAEWNIHVDPHAAKEVFAAYRGLPADRLPVVCALESTERIECRPEHLDRLSRSAGAGGELLSPDDPEGLRSSNPNRVIACVSDALRFYMEFHRRYDQGYLAHLHDLFAAMVATGEATATTRPATVDVETDSPLTFGQTVGDFAGFWKQPPNARVVTANEPEKVFGTLIDRLARLAADRG
ncbi:nucleoside hydrolase [Arthrobacter crusticola]|uniref:Nucleoside hydrolase n=1 Tax=Arthrobacter crusticola TaxID=2547960 RepID=A0A4R5TYY9_9MICC|nr:nucleoside hydrolase [Arthrobacter crusticola]TDK26477.1 nucleoside hydrolase [Arthrobacter crusticola]